jgi:hypothetical protein
MKNKAIHDLVKQLHFDVRTAEENIRSLANDLVRVERLFNELWTYIHKHKGELAEKPEKQMLKCDYCHNWSKDYKIHSSQDGYLTEIECKTCLIEKDKAPDDEGPHIL